MAAKSGSIALADAGLSAAAAIFKAKVILPSPPDRST